MKPVKKILIPTDFSKPAQAAAKYAIELASQMKAEVKLLHVVQADVFLLHGESALMLDTLEAELKANAHKQMNKLILSLKLKKPPLFKIVCWGGPVAVEICAEAKTWRADWIVMSTHGRTGLKRLALGSVAEKVVRLSNCPVLTVRGRGARQ